MISFLIVVVTATLWALLTMLAVHRTRRARSAHEARVSITPKESITILKPLCGVDNDLEKNLRSYFEQDHPRFEIIFGAGEGDPAIELVRRLRDEYEHVPSKLVIHDGARGLNPKVSNLRAMVELASHDIIVISDSNIAVESDYLASMQADLARYGVGLVASLACGVGEQTLGARLDNLQLNGPVAGGTAAASRFLHHPAFAGKSMMFRRSIFDRLGGFSSVADVLAEDYVIGRMFHEAGYQVVLASQPVYNVCSRVTVDTFFQRHVRWGMIRLRMQPFAFVLEPLTNPLVVALVAPLFGVYGAAPLLWAVLLTIARDASTWTTLRGTQGLARALPLFPLRDALMFVAWLVVPFRRHVTWRGNRVRVSAGTRLYPETVPREPTLVLVEE